MAIGYDEGSPAKQYADRQRKLRKELVDDARKTVELMLGKMESFQEKLRQADLSIEKIVQ